MDYVDDHSDSEQSGYTASTVHENSYSSGSTSNSDVGSLSNNSISSGYTASTPNSGSDSESDDSLGYTASTPSLTTSEISNENNAHEINFDYTATTEDSLGRVSSLGSAASDQVHYI